MPINGAGLSKRRKPARKHRKQTGEAGSLILSTGKVSAVFVSFDRPIVFGIASFCIDSG
jgi:hypothetical protein